MRRLILALAFLLAGAANAFGQSTTVSGQITDASTQTWNNATCQFQFAPNPQFPTGPYTWTGGALNRVIPCTANGSGAYSQSVPSNTAISPQGSKWILQVTPNATSPSFSTPPTTITGGTQTLNVTPPAIAIPWANPPGPAISAYADSEITGTLPSGAEYFNTTSLLTRVWNGSAWGNQGSGAGGPSTPCGANTDVQFNNAGACGASANFTFDPSSNSFNVTGTTGFTNLSQGAGGLNQVAVSSSALTLNANAAGSNTNIAADQIVTINSNNSNIVLSATGGLIDLGANASMTNAGALALKQVQAISTTTSDAMLTGATSSNGFTATPSAVQMVANETGSTLTLGGNAGLFFTAGSANSFHFPITTGGAGTCLHTDGGTPQIGSWSACGSGTVTSASFTGGLISVATPTTTPAFTVAGTSGGIPYFSGAATWASSAALTANAVVIGGGVGTAPSTISADTTTTHALFATAGAPAFRALASSDLPAIPLSCEPGLGDGLNAIIAATYLQSTCYNISGKTWTLTGIKCFTDNNGTSSLNVTNGAGTGLLTGAVTCTNAFAAGTQSATVTIANGDFIKFTFVADGTSKQSTWVVAFNQ